MTRNEILRRWPHASEATIRRNLTVDTVEAGQSKQAQVPALDRHIQKRQTGKGNVCVVVSLITWCRRELDDDNNVASLKPIRDAVASRLGLDDADKRIRFEYGQVQTRGEEGVLVKVELV